MGRVGIIAQHYMTFDDSSHQKKPETQRPRGGKHPPPRTKTQPCLRYSVLETLTLLALILVRRLPRPTHPSNSASHPLPIYPLVAPALPVFPLWLSCLLPGLPVPAATAATAAALFRRGRAEKWETSDKVVLSRHYDTTVAKLVGLGPRPSSAMLVLPPRFQFSSCQRVPGYKAVGSELLGPWPSHPSPSVSSRLRPLGLAVRLDSFVPTHKHNTVAQDSLTYFGYPLKQHPYIPHPQYSLYDFCFGRHPPRLSIPPFIHHILVQRPPVASHNIPASSSAPDHNPHREQKNPPGPRIPSPSPPPPLASPNPSKPTHATNLVRSLALSHTHTHRLTTHTRVSV